MRVVSAMACGVLVLTNVAASLAQAPKRSAAAKGVAPQPTTPTLSDDEIATLVTRLDSDPDGIMLSLAKAGMRGLRPAVAQLANPNPAVRGSVALHLGQEADLYVRLTPADRGWIAATLLSAAAKERSSLAQRGQLSGVYRITGSNFALGVIPDSVQEMLRGATSAWAERFAEAVGRGKPGAWDSSQHPDKETVIASADILSRYGAYLQHSGDALLRVLWDSTRATRTTDDALLAAAVKGAAALPDTVVATIVVELLERGRVRGGAGERIDKAMVEALRAMASSGKAGPAALIALSDALSPRAQAAARAGRPLPTNPVSTRVLGYARDKGERDRGEERSAVIEALGAACRAQPSESPRIAEALLRMAFDSTGSGSPRDTKARSRYESRISPTVAARIAAMETLPSCGSAARGAVNALIAVANRGDIGATDEEKELAAAAGKAAAAIQRSK